MDPGFPSPSVRTEIVAERFMQGASIEELARMFGLSVEQVEEALRLAVTAQADRSISGSAR